MQFSHVGISVSDLDRSIAFYRDMLGIEPVMEVMPFGGPDFEDIMNIPGVSGRMCMIGNGSLFLELFEFAGGKPQDARYPVSDQGLTHFGVFVDDIAATDAKLREAGVYIHSPIKTFTVGIQAIYARDPDGNVFEVMEQPKRPS